MPDTRSKEPTMTLWTLAAILISWIALGFTWRMMHNTRKANRITRVLAAREERLRDARLRSDGMIAGRARAKPEIMFGPDGTPTPYCHYCMERYDDLGMGRWGHCCPVQSGAHLHG